MEMSLEEVKDHLMAIDDGFSRLVKEHADYKRQLEVLTSLPVLTEDEQMLALRCGHHRAMARRVPWRREHRQRFADRELSLERLHVARRVQGQDPAAGSGSHGVRV